MTGQAAGFSFGAFSPCGWVAGRSVLQRDTLGEALRAIDSSESFLLSMVAFFFRMSELFSNLPYRRNPTEKSDLAPLFPSPRKTRAIPIFSPFP